MPGRFYVTCCIPNILGWKNRFSRAVAVTGETSAGEDASVKLARRFILVSLVYFVIGAFVMGDSYLLPAPYTDGTYATSFVSDIYTTSYVHIMVLGWASFAIIGMIYYAVPKMAGRPLHSRRLGSVHFWITNIFVPAGIVFVASLSFYLGSLVQGGTTASQLFSMPEVIVSLILLEGILVPVGIIAQGLFAYNVYRTMKG